MKKRLVKPVKKTKLLKKAFLYGGPSRPNDNENCNCKCGLNIKC